MTDLDAVLGSARTVPGLAVGLLAATYARPLAEVSTPPEATAALALDGPAPLARDESVRAAVRDLLRRDGYTPSGRGKPASEYLVKAAEGGRLGPINAAVDACNAVSLHSGLPISVVDLDRATEPLSIDVGGPDDAIVFNASGQEIRLAGLLGLRDADGFCANPIRDSQRTKTHDETTRTLSVVWAPAALAARLATALDWYADLVRESGAGVTTAHTG
ncbi:phenylalanine--tRNA ligase beta subunit-related protein [Rubrivirga sp.]|uniref:phenylalanine--tRNA ligase beta subunit-related protein n=1 Tax=Rubrivirga sp. TaxID=1885344 RepID=UPI003B521D99